jgi:hypothetical protein
MAPSTTTIRSRPGGRLFLFGQIRSGIVDAGGLFLSSQARLGTKEIPMSDYRRVRIDPFLEQQVHRFALRDGRAFDAAAKRLIVIGLEAVNASTSQRPAQAPASHAREL